jgi:predicted glycogen debranching enzyme
MESERKRRSGLLVQAKIPSANENDLSLSAILTLAADQFIVKRGEDLKTIIAGYHWFTDWGRDTMISLPGLCLASGRLDDARKIIEAFAKSASQGMLPNRFQDNQEPPEYNNVDGTLWYFIAIYKYMLAGGDQRFILDQILPVLGDMIDWHFRGTRYNIHVDEDGLLFAGEKGQQLTWMDARIGDWVVTPRMGRPVEVQALWYNALLIYSQLLSLKGDREGSGIMARHAEKARTSFNKRFWNPEGNYLYDNIDERGQPDPALRPNQLFAISLPFPLLQDPEQSISVMKGVEEKLYTRAGLRSLTPDDIHYAGTYGGNAYQRDSAYHEGTVWTWLLGPYVDAVIRVYGKQEGRERAGQIIADFSYHLHEACIGSVSEIMDADTPHHPRGCVAQAWAVAEILRVIREYDLESKPRPEPLHAETK